MYGIKFQRNLQELYEYLLTLTFVARCLLKLGQYLHGLEDILPRLVQNRASNEKRSCISVETTTAIFNSNVQGAIFFILMAVLEDR